MTSSQGYIAEANSRQFLLNAVINSLVHELHQAGYVIDECTEDIRKLRREKSEYAWRKKKGGGEYREHIDHIHSRLSSARRDKRLLDDALNALLQATAVVQRYDRDPHLYDPQDGEAHSDEYIKNFLKVFSFFECKEETEANAA
jgi:hypothetical protein